MARTISIDELLAMLERAPKEIEMLTAGMSAAQLRQRPGTDEWSANEVLAHIRACADVRGGSVAKILGADRPTLRAVNPLTWIKSTNYLDLDFRSSFRAFARQREDLLKILRTLPAHGWSRSATVTGAGRRLERTVHFYAEWVAVHERPHLKQIRQIVETLT
jgi:DinB family protein